MEYLVYRVYEMYEVEDDLGTAIGNFTTPEAARQAIATFILWRMSLGEIDDWHPREAPWGSTLTQQVPGWDWDPTYFDWSSAERWLEANSVRALVEWYRQENPENHLIVEPLKISAAAPLANRQAVEALPVDTFPLVFGNWRQSRNVLEEILDA